MPAPRRYTKELLAEAAARSRSVREVIDHLGGRPHGSAYGHIRRRLDHYGIDTSHFRLRGYQAEPIDPSWLREAAAQAHSLAELLRTLDLPANGTSRRHLKRSLAETAIPTGHFTGQGHNRGRPSPRRKSADDILRPTIDGARRTGRRILHRALQEKDVPYRCAACATGERWLGRRLVLEIDHINGDRLDNRIENLRYLCPSCHSQTRSFARGRLGSQ